MLPRNETRRRFAYSHLGLCLAKLRERVRGRAESSRSFHAGMRFERISSVSELHAKRSLNHRRGSFSCPVSIQGLFSSSRSHTHLGVVWWWHAPRLGDRYGCGGLLGNPPFFQEAKKTVPCAIRRSLAVGKPVGLASKTRCRAHHCFGAAVCSGWRYQTPVGAT